MSAFILNTISIEVDDVRIGSVVDTNDNEILSKIIRILA